MSKESKAPKKYFKLGPNAAIFTDSMNRVVIRNKEVVEVDPGYLLDSGSLQRAKKGGHIVEVEKAEFDAYVKGEDYIEPFSADDDGVRTETTPSKPKGKTDDDLEELTKQEMINLIEKESPVIPEEERKGLSKMTIEDLNKLYRKYYD